MICFRRIRLRNAAISGSSSGMDQSCRGKRLEAVLIIGRTPPDPPLNGCTCIGTTMSAGAAPGPEPSGAMAVSVVSGSGAEHVSPFHRGQNSDIHHPYRAGSVDG
jgi:hypothetical protein